MKHLAKNIYIKKLDEYNFELLEKTHPRDKKTGEFKTDDKGNLRVNYATIGYFSKWDRVWSRLVDFGMEEWVNGDVVACKAFIDTASKNLKEYFDGLK